MFTTSMHGLHVSCRHSEKLILPTSLGQNIFIYFNIAALS